MLDLKIRNLNARKKKVVTNKKTSEGFRMFLAIYG